MASSRPVRLPSFDYYGQALRLVKKVREGRTVANAVALARAYAMDVRDIDCVYEAQQQVGRSAVQIRKHCAVPVAVIKEWQNATRDLGSGRQWTDRKLANLLAKMLKDVHGAVVAEAAREASAQAAKANARHDTKKASQWRRAAANLGAMCQSITDGGFVPVPHPGKSRG
jgi:hypothetical protein